MNKTGKIILWVLAIAAAVALFVVNGSRVSNKQRQRESQELRSNMQYQQMQKNQEKKRLENDPKTQVRKWYNEYMSMKDSRLARNNLRKWIPLYREELQQKKSEALKKNNNSEVESCNRELSWLKEIESELNNH